MRCDSVLHGCLIFFIYCRAKVNKDKNEIHQYDLADTVVIKDQGIISIKVSTSSWIIFSQPSPWHLISTNLENS